MIQKSVNKNTRNIYMLQTIGKRRRKIPLRKIHAFLKTKQEKLFDLESYLSFLISNYAQHLRKISRIQVRTWAVPLTTLITSCKKIFKKFSLIMEYISYLPARFQMELMQARRESVLQERVCLIYPRNQLILKEI